MASRIGFAVVVIAASVGYLVTFAAASKREGSGRAVALAVGILASAAALVMVLFATFVYALRCDENCNENLVPSARTPGWQNTIHAWQWGAQLVLAIATCAAAIAATALLGLRRRALALAIAGVAALCAVAWAVLVVS